MTAFAPPWLTARAIAHRGLHSPRGAAENSLAAADAAIAGGFAIECDVQLSRDGEAMVFHDDGLERLTDAQGPLDRHDAKDLQAVTLRGTNSTIPTLSDLLWRIAARTPLICEIKSSFQGDPRLARRVAEVAATYSGPLALKSFDPDVMALLRTLAPRWPDGAPRPLGVVAMARYEPDDWPDLSIEQRRDCAAFLHVGRTKPDFVSFHIDDLPHATPVLLKALSGAPSMAWTVRTPEQRSVADEFADQIIFEAEGRP